MESSNVPEGLAGREDVESAWVELYKNLDLGPGGGKCAPKLSKYKVYQRAIIGKTLAEIDRRLKTTERVHIWSAGSGIDVISLYLKSARQDAIQLTLQDISKECMSFNERMFSACGLAADFVVGNLFDSKYTGKFDIVINTGLLEHFGASDKSRLLRIFSDSLKPNGVYLTATPFAKAKVYSLCKRKNEAAGKWKVGETPITTMIGVDSGGLVLAEEYQVAASDQLWFVQGTYPALGRLLYPAILGLRTLPGVIDRFLIRIIGGYCLLDVYTKNPGIAPSE